MIYETKPTLTYETKKIFIGKSPRNKWTEFSGGYGNEFDGNTILLETNDNEYVFIGSEVFSFKTKGEIVDYISIVGNNDVPYPYAIDEFKNIYLLIENVIILHTDISQERMKEYDNPYDYYYTANLITDEYITSKRKKALKNSLNIDKWFIGKKSYTLRYEPYPAKTYDYYRENKKMHVIYKNKKKELLTKKNI